MGWIKLDDGFADDPVIANLSDSAFALWVSGIAYCNRKLTDGFIPTAVGYGGLRYCDGNAVTYAVELERSGRWIAVEGGWMVHRYLEWQRSKATILGEREVVKDRVTRFRNADGNDVTHAVGHASKNLEPRTQTKNLDSLARFADFYDAYPRHVGRRAAERAFASAIKRVDAEVIVKAARSFAEDPNLPEAGFIPYPATWLNRDGWGDDPLPRRNGRAKGSVQNLIDMADRMEGK